MAFALKLGWSFLQDASEIYVKDKTQDYVDGDDYGWGEGDTPLQRSAYALLFWAKYIDYAGNESYLDQKNQYVSSTDRKYAVAPGTGLANTDMSIFTVLSASDGHHKFYMLPLIMDTTRVSGLSGDLYYNTDDAKPYRHNGTSWVQITSALLPTLEANEATKICEELTDIRIVRHLNEKKFQIYTPQKGANDTLKMYVRDFKNYLEMAIAAFYEEKQSTARKLIHALTLKVNG